MTILNFNVLTGDITVPQWIVWLTVASAALRLIGWLFKDKVDK